MSAMANVMRCFVEAAWTQYDGHGPCGRTLVQWFSGGAVRS